MKDDTAVDIFARYLLPKYLASHLVSLRMQYYNKTCCLTVATLSRGRYEAFTYFLNQGMPMK